MRFCKFQSLKDNNYQQILQKWLQADDIKNKKEKFRPILILNKLNSHFCFLYILTSCMSEQHLSAILNDLKI